MSPEVVLFAWDVLTVAGGRIPKKTAARHRQENEKRCAAAPAYLEDQAAMAALSFGTHKKADMRYAGCEIIAVYNLLYKKRQQRPLPELIEAFERKGAALRGGFGVSPKAVYRYVRAAFPGAILYLPARNEETLRAELLALSEQADAFIAAVYNDAFDIRGMIHTVCITKEQAGETVTRGCPVETVTKENPDTSTARRQTAKKAPAAEAYILHNAYQKNEKNAWAASKPYPTLESAIAHISKNPKLLCLIVI